MLIIMAIKLDATIQQGLVSFAEHHKNFFIYHCKKCIRSYYTKQTIKVSESQIGNYKVPKFAHFVRQKCNNGDFWIRSKHKMTKTCPVCKSRNVIVYDYW
jgi:Zn finger protein HypA/HybF involved in hydrogenase expression